MKYVTLFLMLILSLNSHAASSIDNTISKFIVSSDASSGSHLIQWLDPIDEACKAANNTYRTRISKLDKDLFSALLSAKMANKKVSFYYAPVALSGSVPGHNSNECMIQNIWF